MRRASRSSRCSRIASSSRWQDSPGELLAAIVPLAMFLLGNRAAVRRLRAVGDFLGGVPLPRGLLRDPKPRRPPISSPPACLWCFGFYARLNSLPMAAAVAGFALPLTLPAGAVWRPRVWLPQVRWRVVIAIASALAIGCAVVRVANVVLHRCLQPLSRHSARVPCGVEARHGVAGRRERDGEQRDDGADGTGSAEVCLARRADPGRRRRDRRMRFFERSRLASRAVALVVFFRLGPGRRAGDPRLGLRRALFDSSLRGRGALAVGRWPSLVA